jgi:hypothetical protein
MLFLFRFTVLILLFNTLYENLQSQIPTTENHGLKLNGTADISSEIYTSNRLSSIQPNETSIRAIILSTVYISDKIEMPVRIYLSTQSGKHQQPFNQIGASPVFFNWLTVHMGYFSTKLSELTFGDHTILGGGVEKKDGKFRFSILYGRMLASLEPDLNDTNNKFLGSFRREGFAFKIGFGEREKVSVDLNLAKMYDNSSSIDTIPNGLYPYENAVGSLSFGVNMLKGKIIIKGEAAFCAFSNDTRIEENKSVHVGPLRILLVPRYSSNIDGAAVLNIKFNPNENYNFGFESKWIGPGYVTLSYPQMQNDVFENSLNTRLNLFTNKLFLTAGATYKINNLRDTRLTTSKTFLGSVTSLWKPSNKFTLNLRFYQYSINSNPGIDTLKIKVNIDSTKVDTVYNGNILKIDNITRSFSVSPSFYFILFNNTFSLMFTYSYRGFHDNSILTSGLNKSISHDIRGETSINFPSSLYLSAGLGFTSSEIAKLKTGITSINQTIGYSLFNYQLNISSNFNYSVTGGNNGGKQISERLTFTYSLVKWGQLNLNAYLNSFKDDSNTNITEYQATLQYLYYF